jgi:hypothetical protein
MILAADRIAENRNVAVHPDEIAVTPNAKSTAAL